MLTQLCVANRSESEFLANISNELRTSLNIIIGFSNALAHDIFGEIVDSRQEETVARIKELGEHFIRIDY